MRALILLLAAIAAGEDASPGAGQLRAEVEPAVVVLEPSTETQPYLQLPELEFGLTIEQTNKALGVLATRAVELPRLVCVGLEGGRRELRHRLIELGTALTGDAVRAEVACERACVLI